jgi:uncharacterized protein (TIGR00369 family)
MKSRVALKGHRIPLDRIKDAVNASPYYQHLGMKLVALSEQGSEVIMTTKDDHMSIYGRVHGGVIASLADSACSLALVAALDENEFIATQNLNVHYILSVEEGVMQAKGRVVHRGRHTAILEADVYDSAGRIVAHAHTVHVIRTLT